MRKILLLLLWCLLGLAGCDRPQGYVRKSGEWRYGDRVVQPEDAATFKPLSDSFARDARRGYYREQAIADSDGPTFEALGEHEARDRLAVYYADTYRKGQEYWSIRHLRVALVREADPASYKLLAHGYARDRQRVFFEGQAFSTEPHSFRVLDRGYAADGRQIWYHGVHVTRDVAGFTLLPDSYARSSTQVFYDGRVVRGADAASFVELETPSEQADARDARHAYLRGRQVDTKTAATSPVRP